MCCATGRLLVISPLWLWLWLRWACKVGFLELGEFRWVCLGSLLPEAESETFRVNRFHHFRLNSRVPECLVKQTHLTA